MNARTISTIMLMLAVTGVAACSSMPSSQTTKDLQTAPQYTDAEKNAMTEEQKIALYNESMSQEKNEVVCRRTKPVGSHMTKTVCRTRAEIEQDQEMSQEALRQTRGKPWDTLPPGGQ